MTSMLTLFMFDHISLYSTPNEVSVLWPPGTPLQVPQEAHAAGLVQFDHTRLVMAHGRVTKENVYTLTDKGRARLTELYG